METARGAGTPVAPGNAPRVIETLPFGDARMTLRLQYACSGERPVTRRVTHPGVPQDTSAHYGARAPVIPVRANRLQTAGFGRTPLSDSNRRPLFHPLVRRPEEGRSALHRS